ncbi:probable unsaturated glucuronyl hydrolase involved in regulation of bacterial surface properties, and related proteins [Rhynchosporium graminicola]|uniref:Probable unsaturated glucuronyl hydrolase involved in regulation of bacterial surface properties, and related proteins n=1 Tax=Rhynchosporium graminicola TaxID=2792576 RepID=A0A1E1KIC6_9HELO|nr:probable unsaturated glucuronyl hydrolase involved in regulation of bacterial surface properties, and related proteins [Rhynchosporium commune]
MPTTVSDITATSVHDAIALLTHNLVNITDTTGEFLMTLPDGRIIDTKGWNDWEWTHGIGLYGLYKYHTLTSSPLTLKIIQDWFSNRFSAGGTTKNINTMAAFLTLAYVYEETGEKTYLPWLDAWAEWAMYDLERTEYGGMQHITYLTPNTEQLWDDTLMMTVLPLAKIGKVLNRPHYVEEAKRQFLIHIKYLFDPTSGLWFHGWQFDPSAEGGVGHNFARARWARGNSWITIVIPEFIELLDLAPTDPLRIHLIDTLEAQCRALKRYQDESGLWRTLIDHADEGSYLESSATAGFAYGILKAVRKKYISAEYEEVALRAVKAVLGQIDERGELLNTSFGTGMGDSLQFYKDIKRTSMPYGQAMAIMCLGEFLRKFI